MANGAPLLTVVVPVFNEVGTIDELLSRVVAAPYDKQIIVVDDGSTDGSGERISEWGARSLIEVCRHTTNRGKGRAIRSALERATGRFTIIQDGDLETDPQDYPLLIEPLLNRSADLVVGSRFLNRKSTIGSFFSPFRLGVRLLNVAVRVLYGVRMSDEACCYKALPTECLKSMDLQCEGFEFCSEVVAKALCMGLRLREVAVRYAPRSSAAGKKIRYGDGVWALWCLWKFSGWRKPARHGLSDDRRAPPV